MYYYGTNYALDEIGFDYGANMIATGTIQLLAFVVLSNQSSNQTSPSPKYQGKKD